MAALLTVLMMTLTGGQDVQAKKIVLIAAPLGDQPKGSYEYEKTVLLLKHCLRNARVDVHFNGWPADPSTLDDADAIFVSGGPDLAPERQAVLDRQIARGCGLVRHVPSLEARDFGIPADHPVARGVKGGAARVAGRTVTLPGGRLHADWWNADFRKLVLNALTWAASIDVPAGGVESTLEGPFRVRLLTGHHYPAHEWKITTAPFISVVEQDPRVVVDVTEDLDDLTRLDGHHALVINYMNWGKPGLSDAQKQGLAGFVERGGGMVVFHGATGVWNKSICPRDSHWPEFQDRITARWWASGSGHDNFGPFRVENIAPDHEITRGLAAFDTQDELYIDLGGKNGVAVVAAQSKVAGRQEPLAWAHTYGKGRVFVTALGHGIVSIRSAGALFRRATTWAASAPPLAFDPPAEQTAKEPVRPGTWTPKQARD